MKIEEAPRWPPAAADLALAIGRQWLRMAQQLNALAEGELYAAHNAATTAPTTGDYAVGDQVRNSTPAEAGSGGSKYVIVGWVCVASGTPGTWVEMRVLTGN